MYINMMASKLLTLQTQTITLTGSAVNNTPQKTQDLVRKITPQQLLAEWSLVELSLAELSLTEPSLAELSFTQLTGYDWWDQSSSFLINRSCSLLSLKPQLKVVLENNKYNKVIFLPSQLNTLISLVLINKSLPQ